MVAQKLGAKWQYDMKTKICVKCNIEKNMECFQAQTNAKEIIYYARACKPCTRDKLNLIQKEWRSRNKKHIADYNKKNKEIIRARSLKFCQENRAKLRKKIKNIILKTK